MSKAPRVLAVPGVVVQRSGMTPRDRNSGILVLGPVALLMNYTHLGQSFQYDLFHPHIYSINIESFL